MQFTISLDVRRWLCISNVHGVKESSGNALRRYVYSTSQLYASICLAISEFACIEFGICVWVVRCKRLHRFHRWCAHKMMEKPRCLWNILQKVILCVTFIIGHGRSCLKSIPPLSLSIHDDGDDDDDDDGISSSSGGGGGDGDNNNNVEKSIHFMGDLYVEMQKKNSNLHRISYLSK